MNNPTPILITDDEQSSREMLASLLEENHTLHFAHNGAECLEKLQTVRPSLLLLDVVLPDISGIEICQQMKKDNRLSNIPTILVTVKTDDEDVKQGLEAGAVDYIKKPIRHLELLARVNAALRMGQYVTQLREADTRNQQLITELNKALSEVKELSGLLPICAQCKNIRNDKGYWQQIEEFIHEHADVQFSHSLCPNCARNIYGSESWFPPSD